MSTEKTKKYVLALEAYQKFADRKDSMPKREFRALVVEEMKTKLDISNAGTVGMYYAWADRQINKRPAKMYSRGDGARARKVNPADAKLQDDLNKLSASFTATTKKAAKKKDGDAADFVAPGAFGARL